VFTKVSLPRAFTPVDDCVIDAGVLLAYYLECVKLSTQVDGVAAATRSFTTDRAIAAVVWVRLRAIDLEHYRSTMT
jgi:hypothetical protein